MRDSNAPKGYKGLSIDLMEVLAAIGKFDYDIKETTEHGNRLENGAWTGIVGQVFQNSFFNKMMKNSITNGCLH